MLLPSWLIIWSVSLGLHDKWKKKRIIRNMGYTLNSVTLKFRDKLFFFCSWTFGTSVNYVLVEICFDVSSRWCVNSFPFWFLGKFIFCFLDHMGHWFNEISFESIGFPGYLFITNVTQVSIYLSWYVEATLNTFQEQN